MHVVSKVPLTQFLATAKPRLTELTGALLVPGATSPAATLFLGGAAGRAPPPTTGARELSGHGDTVFHRPHAGGRPGGVLNCVSLIPVVHFAFEDDAVIVADGDADCFRFNFGVPFQCVFNLPLDVLGFHMRPDFNVVHDPPHARELPDVIFGCLLLIIPIGMPRERN